MNEIRVQVEEGKLKGVVVNGCNNVRYLAFRGIPYAKPPVGELRFKDPVPAEPWCGERDATKYGNIAVQIDRFTNKVVGDEDCLYLNVYTMKIEPPRKSAVMVWIHGGGYFLGSGNPDWYGPDYIIKKDVVLVSLNYRLASLGFLNLNDTVITGNQAVKDAIMALKWIKKNIKAFGGDPEKITIFGESAGASMVHALALSPLAKGLFQKIIAQSGVLLNPWAFNERMDSGFRLAKKLGKETSDPKVAYEFLKTVDAKTLIENSLSAIATEEKLSVTLFWTITLDNKSSNPVFPEHPKEYIRRGIQIPFLLGFNRDEGIFLIRSNFLENMSDKDLQKVNDDFKRAILPNVLSMLPKIGITVEELRYHYFENKEISEKTLMNYSYYKGDEFFVRGVRDVVELQKSSGHFKSTYLYHFDYESETSLMRTVLNIGLPGVSHTEDLGYLFFPEIVKSSNLTCPKPGSNDYKMVNDFVQMWTDFAKTGNPTPTTNLWLPQTGPQNKDYNYLNIDLNPQMKIFRYGKERWDWESI
ncbi:esterase FE4-like isoform X2 [Mycetomoellerius zeteki]|nr:PREDICTED: esterase FE4-like isoform X2 [Trachymyrmex zeteki]XP_018312618.1 PREDICTED: esterase FE4-like isoform X2 [Trachymyrmex zeteki]XP_018312619.1 PREDICTED: esterase FE4-like isoform X2 [Trachymyrmex zeteki]XP_018312620.1 PREDICTED: esterase FE4-like isoform X2 [Trachymyrmex zeteki]